MNTHYSLKAASRLAVAEPSRAEAIRSDQLGTDTRLEPQMNLLEYLATAHTQCI